MPLKPFQKELMSGKHTGLGSPPEKVPNDEEWKTWVQNATQGLSQLKLTIHKPLTDHTLVGAALARYNQATATHTTNDPLDLGILGSLLVDIYSLTGAYMRRILRDDQRSDYDCQFFAVYKAMHFAVADELGALHKVPGDQIEVLLQKQMIGLTDHGKEIDRQQAIRKHLVYLEDIESLAYRLHIDNGKLYCVDPLNKSRALFDTTAKEWTLAGGNSCHLGIEANQDLKSSGQASKGVAGFCMTLNRNLYAFRHFLKDEFGGAFYHSSYTGGSDVLCTGCLTVEKGILTYINNFSGHYRPSPTQLQLVVDHLQSFGVPLAGVNVQVLDVHVKNVAHSPVMSAKDFLKHQEYRKLQFDPQARGRVPPPLTVERERLRQKDLLEMKLRAVLIRKALNDYIERSQKWYAKPSEKSINVANHLRKVVNDEDLVKETRFLLGIVKDSPLNTPIGQQLDQGELKTRLGETLKPRLVPTN